MHFKEVSLFSKAVTTFIEGIASNHFASINIVNGKYFPIRKNVNWYNPNIIKTNENA